MTTSRSPWTKLLFVMLLLPVSGYVVFWVSLYSVGQLVEGWHPSWFGDATRAEVIAISPGNSPDAASVDLVAYSSAATYTSTHPGSTFLVPIGRLNEVTEQLKTSFKIPWITFEIKPLSDGSEDITVEYMDRTDDTHGAHYKATRDAVQLRSYRYAGDRDGMGILLLAMALTVIVHLAVIGHFAIRALYHWRSGRAS